MSLRVNYAPLAMLLLVACATTGADAAKVPLAPLAEAPLAEALGASVWSRDGQRRTTP